MYDRTTYMYMTYECARVITFKYKREQALITAQCKINNVCSFVCLCSDIATVVPTKSDIDVKLCLQSISKTLTCTPNLELTRIDRSLVYQSYPEDRINTQVIYRL